MLPDRSPISSRRYIFDISGIADYISKHPRYSGIQRVVATLIPHFFSHLQEAERADVYYGVYDRKTGIYTCGPLGDIVDAMQRPEDLAIRLRVSGSRGTAGARDLKPLAKYRKSPLKFYFHRTRFDLLYLRGKDGPFLRQNMTRDQWRTLRWPKPGPDPQTPGPAPTRVDLNTVARPGDVMVLLDSSWSPSVNNVFKAMKDRGLTTQVMVYDMIALSAPGYVVKSLAQTFALWLKRSVEYADGYITISHSVRRELERFLQINGADQPVRALPLVQSFPVGAGPVASHGPLADMLGAEAYPLFSQGLAFDDRLRALGQKPFVLCVGTMEIRKNPLRLAQAWLRLAEKSGGDVPTLVFAGGTGWMVDDFERLMQATGNLYGHAQRIEGPSDAELQFLYRNCLFLAMPSLYEGWGLPVGEALSFGKTALVSDCSSLPEVGQDLVEYCDPNSVRSIADAAWRLLETPDRRQALEARIAAADLRGWEDVARDLHGVLVTAG